ncbi:MAG: serine palmitoyltransferase small subunit family protein [Opitutales bacterium]|jgi:hypothetical protein|nr:serine palmitoyltransferase small subunit family protein [Opitutales bacterium]MDP4777443.1 serine palmitoyltransferase small subunit family protein [Opitutales bacterium]MDP4883361.1 serine palmitoyltransferase small subunit family protein [Opitutales bacterium]MDP5080380.1 serine palmitoyltransferase small subunit family protein [Opitutales bacterium]
MPLTNQQSPVAAPTSQLPELPAGPSLDRVRGPVEIPMFEPWQITLFIVLGLIALALIIWAIIAFVRHLRNQHIALAPATTALAELEAAAALTTDDERFAVLSTNALRRYFEEGLNIPAKGRTSEEFLRSLKGNTQLDHTYSEQLSQFLAQCDGIKFAQQTVDSDQRTKLTTLAKELIQQAEATKEDAPS